MTKTSALWGVLIAPAFFVWVLLMRVVFVLAGYNPSVIAGARGALMVLLAVVGTALTMIAAYENAPHGD